MTTGTTTTTATATATAAAAATTTPPARWFALSFPFLASSQRTAASRRVHLAFSCFAEQAHIF